jgi:hypothetical protein
MKDAGLTDSVRTVCAAMFAVVAATVPGRAEYPDHALRAARFHKRVQNTG